MKTTQAAILVAQHQPLLVDTIELPDQLDVGQVLVEVKVVVSAARSWRDDRVKGQMLSASFGES